jgi:hypothetical protein
MPVSGTVTAAPKAMATVTAGKMIARAVCGYMVSTVMAAPATRATATAAKMIVRFMPRTSRSGLFLGARVVRRGETMIIDRLARKNRLFTNSAPSE